MNGCRRATDALEVVRRRRAAMPSQVASDVRGERPSRLGAYVAAIRAQPAVGVRGRNGEVGNDEQHRARLERRQRQAAARRGPTPAPSGSRSVMNGTSAPSGVAELDEARAQADSATARRAREARHRRRRCRRRVRRRPECACRSRSRSRRANRSRPRTRPRRGTRGSSRRDRVRRRASSARCSRATRPDGDANGDVVAEVEAQEDRLDRVVAARLRGEHAEEQIDLRLRR